MSECAKSVVPQEFLRLALSLAETSAKPINAAYLDARLKVDEKHDRTPVTQADRDAEELMRNLIRKAAPEHGVIGEEFGPDNADAEWVWVLDPIDGTLAFIHGVPLFTTLIGLLYRGDPVLGVIHQPTQGLICHNEGDVCFLNHRVVRCAAATPIEKCTLLCSDFENVARYQPQYAGNFRELCARVDITRTWADGYGYLLLASGYAHVMCDPVLNPWDVLPVAPIVRASGAVITDWGGSDALPMQSSIAAPAETHAEILHFLRGM